MKIIYAGTPEFAAVALQALHAAGHDISLVLTQPDRPAGRGMQLQASPVKEFAVSQGIPVAQPMSLRLDGKHPHVAQETHDLLHSVEADVMVVAAYGLILPRSVLDIPKHGCINIHASLLPRWRGAAPIHRAIEAGDASTGVTIMQMEEGLDTGPMLAIESLPITAMDTTGSLHDKLAALGAKMIVATLARLGHGRLPATPQPDSGVTYAAKISKEEARLDFTQPAIVLSQKIRAFNPFPGAFGMVNDVPLKFWQAEVVPAQDKALPGDVVSADANGVVIACGSDALRVTLLQKPGGKRLSSREFLQGFPLEGARFSD